MELNTYWYLASPYSKHPAGLEQAAFVVCEQAGLLMQSGVPVFSPIAHTHYIAVAAKMNPLDHIVWLPIDEPMMRAAHGLIVLKDESWETSYGVGVEIEEFNNAGKPVIYMELGVVPKELADYYA